MALLVRADILNKLNIFKDYKSRIEEKYDQELTELHEKYIEQAKGLNEYELGVFREDTAEDRFYIEDIYTKIHVRSTLVTLYSFLENSLNRLCNQLESRNSYPLKLNELRGDGIFRAKLFLEKLALIDFRPVNPEWMKISDMNKLRNCIIHCEGNIKKTKNESAIKEIIKKNKSLECHFSSELIVKKEYVDELILTIEKLITELFEQALYK